MPRASTKNHGPNKTTTRAQTLKKNKSRGAHVHRVLENGAKNWIRRKAMRTAYGKHWPELATPVEKDAAKDWVSSRGAAGLLVINGTTFTVDRWRAFHEEFLLSKSREIKQRRAAARELEGKGWSKDHSVNEQAFIVRAAEVAPFVDAHEAAGIVTDDA